MASTNLGNLHRIAVIDIPDPFREEYSILVQSAARMAEDCIREGRAQKEAENCLILPGNAVYTRLHLKDFLPDPINLQEVERVRSQIFSYQRGTFRFEKFYALVLIPLVGFASMYIMPRLPNGEKEMIDWKPGHIIIICGPCDLYISEKNGKDESKNGECTLIVMCYEERLKAQETIQE
ncbi:MAG: hypothetical protein M1834_007170 [Cirrosporium novae-zelandiae]|nr:MAG: hypothetical protein M1834_007170 [Cirrosporium novae-zelandiae]